jgi:hypothetical protein
MQKRDQAVLAALVIGLLVGAAATYALAGVALGRTTTTTTTLTSTTTATTTVLCPSNTTCGSFTVLTSTGQVQVDSVQATQFVCQGCGAVNGTSYVRFAVTFENVGNSPIYIRFGSAGLSSSVVANSSVPSTVLQEVPANSGCGLLIPLDVVNPGQTYTMYTPTCSVVYQQVQAGTVAVRFSFNWTTNANPTDFPNSTTIAAGFMFQ